MKEPPDQTAVLSAASLLSLAGITVPKCSRNSSGCSLSAWSVPRKITPWLLEILADVVVDDLGVVLAADAGKVLLLRFGDAELVVGAADVVGHVVPALDRLVRAGDVVVDVLEVDPIEIGAPARHRPRFEVPVGLQAQLRHPLRLALDAADLRDDLSVDSLRERGAGLLGVIPAVLVAVGDLGQSGIRKGHGSSLRANPD